MTERIRCAWHVLMGRPLVYRARFPAGIRLVFTPELWVVECSGNTEGEEDYRRWQRAAEAPTVFSQPRPDTEGEQDG